MTASDGTVTATYSRRMRLQLDNAKSVEARIKGKTLQPVCGDRVTAEPIEGESDWLITDIHDRRNALTRPSMRGKTETLAANIDRVIVVAAAKPDPDWFIVDRYVCAAELMDTAAAIVFNKTDIAFNENTLKQLRVYGELGYATVACSAETGENFDAFADLLDHRTAIVVGQSGVGKSTLLNRLCADSGQKTAAISDKTGEGRHTTVNSVMIDLPNGGAVIDSPGVRDYAPALASPDDAVGGFREIRTVGRQCRFANCRHLREPDCAVKQGIETGDVDPRRYESYKRTIALTERLKKNLGPGA